MVDLLRILATFQANPLMSSRFPVPLFPENYQRELTQQDQISFRSNRFVHQLANDGRLLLLLLCHNSI